MLFNICKIVLFVNPTTVAILYTPFVFLLSTLAEIFPLPELNFSENYNILDIIILKPSLPITGTLLLIFVLLTSSAYCCGDFGIVAKHISRIFIFVTFTYLVKYLFKSVNYLLVLCWTDNNSTISKTKDECISSGYSLYLSNISGHIFILFSCAIAIIEEAHVFKGWLVTESYISNEDDWFCELQDPFYHLSENQFTNFKRYYLRYNFLVKTIFVIMAVYTLLLFLSILVTILYFDTTMEKTVGSLIGIFCWYITYGLWFQKLNEFPLAQGEGLIDYFKLNYIFDVNVSSNSSCSSTRCGFSNRNKLTNDQYNERTYLFSSIDLQKCYQLL